MRKKQFLIILTLFLVVGLTFGCTSSDSDSDSDSDSGDQSDNDNSDQGDSQQEYSTLNPVTSNKDINL